MVPDLHSEAVVQTTVLLSQEPTMKYRLWKFAALGCLICLAGCNTSSPTGSSTPPPAEQHTTTTVEKRTITTEPNHTEVREKRTDTTAREGNVDVKVGKPGEKPAVDVESKPGGGVHVDVDRS